MSTCPRCDTHFAPTSPRQKYCTTCIGHPIRLRPPTPVPPFIGVDGEGVTEDDTHRYVLLSAGASSITGPNVTWLEAFDHLWNVRVFQPDAIFVGFYLSYDFAQWFRTLPEERARMLFTDKGRLARTPKSGENHMPWPVRYQGWEFDILGLRRLKFRPENGGGQWLYVCDGGPFWQTSLLSMLDPAKWTEPVCTDTEYATLVAGKAHRADAKLDQDMVDYNVLENRVYSVAMDRLRTGFLANGWKLKRSQWFGPGQAADIWLRTTDAPTSEQVQDCTFVDVLFAARASFYGGWFEIPRHGLVPGTTYEYDVNSAYPAIISTLPCLLHGSWRHTPYPPGVFPTSPLYNPSRLALVRVTTRGSDQFLGGLPHRNSKGIISRPRSTSGWYWLHEVRAAQRTGLIDTYVIHESWDFMQGCGCPPPMRQIRDLYQQRLTVGKNTVQGKALRLVYNSAYGKFAQSVGDPRYANPIYASLITAGCRVYILDAIASHPQRSRAVLMVATDGVYFRDAHPTLFVDPERLGAWDCTAKENLTLFMPGVYWDDKSRTNLAAAHLKSRGINGAELAQHISAIDDSFRDLAWDTGTSPAWPKVEIPVRFSVVSPHLALARGKWETCGDIHAYRHGPDEVCTCNPRCPVKVLSSDPSNKRDTTRTRLVDGLITTAPYESFGHSVPYSRSFGMDLESMLDNDTLVTDDGTINRELYELLGGHDD